MLQGRALVRFTEPPECGPSIGTPPQPTILSPAMDDTEGSSSNTEHVSAEISFASSVPSGTAAPGAIFHGAAVSYSDWEEAHLADWSELECSYEF